MYNSSLSKDICELVRKAESDFTSGTTKVSKYVDISIYEDINKIYAYLESKHISGDTDSMGREKPFFNIVLAARNIWYRATDIDRNNIKIRATKSEDDTGAFLATVHIQDWMRRNNFGAFLNAWGINSAGFNESVVKFVKKDDQLVPSVVPWNRIICDTIDFASNPKIEILELTEAQIRKNKSYDQDIVEALCTAITTRETLAKEKKDNKADYIRLYEVHGELPKSFLTGNEEDKDEYVQQMHVISFVAGKEQGEFDDFTLFSGKEEQDPYLLTALLPEVDGSIALRGSVKTLFDTQWMQNHTAKAIKDQLDLASKLIFQTSDPTFAGQNAISAIETGDVLVHKVNEPITMLNNKADIVALQSYGLMWKSLGNEISGISEQMLGVAPKSGTAWRQTNALLQESHSLFELMTENKGLALEEMFRKFIIPYVKTKMDTTDEVSATLASHDIQKLDAKYIKNSSIQKSNQVVKERILNGQEVTQEDQQALMQSYAQETQGQLQEQGNQRFFVPDELPDKTWKETFKDLEWDIECDFVNENVDQNAAQTLNELLKFFQSKQGMPLSPEEKFVVEKIMRFTGTVSTLELANMPQSPPPQPQEPEDKVSQSINFKDMSFEGQQQLAQKAGIQLTQPKVEPVETTKPKPDA